jgi:hypothetical protein
MAETALIDIPDNALLREFMDMFRELWENSDAPPEDSRQRFRAVSAEMRRRGTLKAPF